MGTGRRYTDRDYPEVVQQAGIRKMLQKPDGGQYVRQRISQMVREDDFPAPAGRLATGMFWRTDEVIAWAVRRGYVVKAPPREHTGDETEPGTDGSRPGKGHGLGTRPLHNAGQAVSR